MNTKTCKKCNITSRNSEFNKLKNSNKRSSICYSCNKKSGRERYRKFFYKSLGITIEDYQKLLTKQNGKCWICKIHYKNFGKALSLDHCHGTGKIRGLLCNNCNLALGYFKEDVVRLYKGIKYLKEYS